jgi:hypothetical protein
MSTTDHARHKTSDPAVSANTTAPVNYQNQIVPIGKVDLLQIQQDILATTHPQWQSSPPPKFGTPGAGKLKADQLHSCIEFDILVSLMKLWSDPLLEDNDGNGRQHKLLDSTMLLAIAVCWATSHWTSVKHAYEYTKKTCEHA